ncbi:hypothetical protein EVAR_47935_1 [Eumeta japonica]|uniref:Uncharacterized protein n=1 Tax=Eumeta variegata TaxID=151549 RepID=A0A4C1Y6T6_EUMVA|nr:hypothetical protein EVAR_47935_1 [Eumeta japonica]
MPPVRRRSSNPYAVGVQAAEDGMLGNSLLTRKKKIRTIIIDIAKAALKPLNRNGYSGPTSRPEPGSRTERYGRPPDGLAAADEQPGNQFYSRKTYERENRPERARKRPAIHGDARD